MSDTPGAGDCQARSDLWGQPALAVSSWAYVIAGLYVLWWMRRRDDVRSGEAWLFALGLMAAGVGSLDYHGPVLGPEPLAHDVGISVALLMALWIDLRRLSRVGPLRAWGLIALATLLVTGTLPEGSSGLVLVVSAGLLVAEALLYRRGVRRPSGSLCAAIACLVVGLVAFSVSRTGGPLCDPTSWMQGHALWHVLTAIALALWGTTALPFSAVGAEPTRMQEVPGAG